MDQSLDLLVPLANVAKNDYWVSIEALNAITFMRERASSARAQIEALPDEGTVVPKLKEYAKRLLENIRSDTLDKK